ncbi:MAG: helicase, partial [Micrococcales bacterium]|nr:helicase [Micrococcales bacterium]
MSTPASFGVKSVGSSGYELRHELDGSSWSVRENLVDILSRELLGPDGGDDELLGVPPDARYILGRIAPTKLRQSQAVPESDAADGDSTLDLGDDLAASESTGVPLSDVDDSAPDGDEDTGGDRDDEPVRRGLMIPASMGLRFQVPRNAESFTVRASWGVYNPEKTGETTKDGREVRKYRRRPWHVDTRIAVRDLTPDMTAEFVLHEDVTLRVDAHVDHELDRLLVEVALCNDRETPRRIPTNAWMFQTQLHVDADGQAVFLPVHDAEVDDRVDRDAEVRRLELQYRDRLEFAIGRTCSVDWHQVEGARVADRVWTTWLPSVETPQTAATDVPGALLDMSVLAIAGAAQVEAGLRPVVDAYDRWLDEQEAQVASLPTHLRETAAEAVAEARQVRDQLADGLDLLTGDAEALRCFQFMNLVMADQRVHSQIAEQRAKDEALSVADAERKVLAGMLPHSWRVFQIAFILMQLRALTEPSTRRRSGKGTLARVELLFFPTGGGKTEAYLGLAAYAFAIRRRQGLIASPDGPLDGMDGVTVLMRYTLRLLTSQQFQRATTLVCAAELARRADPAIWGAEPFRIGLWVGTSVSPKRVLEAADELRKLNARQAGAGYRFSALQLRRCPWCGTPLSYADVTVDENVGRVYVRCPDPFATCPFSQGGQV